MTKDQFDKCNEWFNSNRGKTKMSNDKQYAIDTLKEAIKICEDYSVEEYKIYKSVVGSQYHEGLSDGAEVCIIILEELLERITEHE